MSTTPIRVCLPPFGRDRLPACPAGASHLTAGGTHKRVLAAIDGEGTARFFRGPLRLIG
jgi:hypothetical protein